MSSNWWGVEKNPTLLHCSTSHQGVTSQHSGVKVLIKFPKIKKKTLLAACGAREAFGFKIIVHLAQG